MILAPDRSWAATRSAIAARELAPLAESLAAELDRLLPDEDVFIPEEKAAMSRHGGRCRRDGLPLEFDPRSPRRHRCAVCGTEYAGESDYRWWVMGYQLWLAERAVHAALLWRLLGTERHGRLGWSILRRLADRYAGYPNADNVLGPTRVFFSTYLESIWLLQLSVALSMLEDGESTGSGAPIRDRIIEPSARLIESFNEGDSNRQVWNGAALAAAGRLLERPELVDAALFGPGGLVGHLRDGLLEDGSWYEGENYHLFAHRGLWYFVLLAESAGAGLPETLVRRFERAFTAPLRTALPDLTFPARRDSQYRVSLRQWRFAESLELGLARVPGDPVLAAGLHRIYDNMAPHGDGGRWRSTAEAERNLPDVRLTRADLGWKSLLGALPGLPAVRASLPTESALLPAQGYGVIRRDEGRVYVALDYGHHGGGHGHPDRLNLWLVTGTTRVLEDVGTGSYVDPSLPWYRSTLAHNAPLVNARSQDPSTGTLRAWDSRDGLTWIDAEGMPAPGVTVRRTVVVGEGYLIDRLAWSAPREVRIDLPWHVEGEIEGAPWQPATLQGGTAPDDGFPFVTAAECAGAIRVATIRTGPVFAQVHAPAGHEWWRATAPGPPGEGARSFLLVRCRGRAGLIVSAWSWNAALRTSIDGESLVVERPGGERHLHTPDGQHWSVDVGGGRHVKLGGHPSLPTPALATPAFAPESGTAPEPLVITSLGPDAPEPGTLAATEAATGGVVSSLRFSLGAAHYRRSEETWTEAGSPRATVVLAATDSELIVELSVLKTPVFFAPPLGSDENPLDNEHPDINSDGVQVHFAPDAALPVSWILVPEVGSSRVRCSTTTRRPAPAISATWRQTPDGYLLRAHVPFDAQSTARTVDLAVDVIVNEMPPGRARRRGQLVLSGGHGEWIYLRGDRQPRSRLIPIRVRRG